MGFWSDLKSIIVDSDTNQNNEETTFIGGVKGFISDTTETIIEKSLWGVQKYYNIKINMVNKVSEIVPEWDFFDVNFHNKVIEERDKKVISLQERLNVVKENEEASKNTKIKLLQEIGKLNLELKYDSMTENDKKVKTEKLKTDFEEIKKIDEQLIELNNESTLLQQELNEIISCLLVEKSFDFKKIKQCQEMSEQYKIYNEFTLYGLRCLDKYAYGELEEAIILAGQYYNNSDKIYEHCKQPWLSYNVAKYLFKIGEIAKAIEYMTLPLKLFPDNIELHEFLYIVYNSIGNIKKTHTEKEILDMLS